MVNVILVYQLNARGSCSDDESDSQDVDCDVDRCCVADTNGDNQLDEAELEALFQKEVSSSTHTHSLISGSVRRHTYMQSDI